MYVYDIRLVVNASHELEPLINKNTKLALDDVLMQVSWYGCHVYKCYGVILQVF